jgi:starch-binding outer membrane protein, SusD/RagB family
MTDFLRGKGARALPRIALAAALILGAGCDTNKLVEVQNPATLRPEDLNNLGAVPALVNGAFRQFVGGYSGLGDDAFLSSSAAITDEAYYGDTFTTRDAADKRILQPPVLGNISDAAFARLQQARFNARRAFGVVTQFSTAATASADAVTKAQLRTIEGYVYTTLSEGWCGSIPFSKLPDTGAINPNDIEPGDPIGTRAMNDTAVVRFTEALATNPNNRLASVGKARSLLNLGKFAEAAAEVTVAKVPTNYVFLLEHSQNTSAENNPIASLQQNGRYGVSDFEGGTVASGAAYRPDIVVPTTTVAIGAEGLGFRSAQDPRVPFEKRNNAQGTCFSASVRCWLNDNYPKFDADVPLASGVEARLIEAEASLQAGTPAVMMTKLNELRANVGTLLLGLYPDQKQTFTTNGVTNSLAPLADPADPTTSAAAQFEARRAMLFRERAFWLYNTGHRQGDLRRLMRAPYSLPMAQVWPTGPHFRGGNYGTDVAYPLPVAEANNVKFNPASCSTTTP